MEKELKTCPNCERKHDLEFDFCPHCGQKTKDELTIGVLFYNTISNYFSFDARFLKSFIPLVIKPGFLAKKFLEGKRLLYLHPAQMYLFISVIFFFLFSFVVRDQAAQVDETLKRELDRAEKTIDTLKQTKLDSAQINAVMKPIKDNQKAFGLKDEELASIDSIVKNNDQKYDKSDGMNFNLSEVDSLIEAGVDDSEIYEYMGMPEDAGLFKRRLYAQSLKFIKNRSGGTILKSFYDSIPIAMFFLLPIFAFILKILYYKRGKFAHHLVFSFYFFSFLFTVFCLLLIGNMIWENFPWWITLLIVVSTYFYLLIALKRFYEQGWFFSFFKSGVATFTFLAIVIPFAFVVMFFMAFLFY